MIGYSDLNPFQREERAKFIENLLEEYHTLITEANGQVLMWDKAQMIAGRKFIDQTDAEMKKLEYQFREMQKRIEQREALMAGAYPPDGDSQELLSRNSDELNRGDRLISELSQNVSQAKDSGLNIMDALNTQRRKIQDIDEHLTRLDTNVETGELIITEMLCRNERRKYFLWGMIALLVIAIGIFLYFLIFK